VKSKPPNAWGFYDMHSGGWERVADTNGKMDRVDVVDPAHIPPEDSGAAERPAGRSPSAGVGPARKHGHFGKGHWSYPVSECEFITSEDTDERGFYRFRVVVEADLSPR
jgi:formylglycine-generating enzyme required for sulfatase activity